VYRARDTRLGRDVAIKELPDALARDADRLRRFEQVLPLPRLRRSQSKCSGFDTVFIR